MVLRLRYTRIAVALAVGCWQTLATEGSSPLFEPAYFHLGGGPRIELFPSSGVATEVELPSTLVSHNLIAFGRDAKSVYLQMPNSGDSRGGLVKVEFKPTRQMTVPGSIGIGDVWSLTDSASGRIFVSASGGRTAACGVFEIDVDAGTRHALRVGAYPDCGGGVGQVSQDGKRLLSRKGEQLMLLDLETGAIQRIGTGRGYWSPDARWIAASGSGRIVLIDARDVSRRKVLGASGIDDHLVWSPDSNYVLFVKRELRCFGLGDFESLEMIDIKTGRKGAVENGHCSVTSSAVGWIDPVAVQ